jgi:hypothetical protein
MLHTETLENRRLLSSVTGFTLINTDTNQAIGSLVQGETIDLGKLGTSDLTVVANTNPAAVGSVVFAYDSTSVFHLENKAPYAFDGKINSGGYFAWTPTLGAHTIKATPFSAVAGAGTAGTALSVGFNVINSASAAAVTGFTLVNADNGKSLGALTQGETIDLGKLGTSDLTVLANTSTPAIGSVVFGYDSTPAFHLENFAPFAFNGKIDSGGYHAWTPTLGAHTIKATPFSAPAGAGAAGSPLSVGFNVINTGVVSTSSSIQVSITNPINGASQAAPGYYVIRTNTSDSSGSISSVSFYANGKLIGTADALPFMMAWENASAGSYTLTAVATDGKGSKTSPAVNVTIMGPPIGHTYYVSPTGNNSNSGSSATSALQTISAAANLAQPGDTVLIEPGTYHEAVGVPRGGTSSAPITFKAVKPGTAIIDGADPLGNWTHNSGSNPVFTTAWNHDFLRGGSRFYGGPTTDGTSTAIGYAEEFLYNGAPLIQVLSSSSLAAGKFYVNYSARTVSVWLPGGATPTSSNMEGATRNHLFFAASTSVQYVRVDGLIMEHAANFSQDQAVITATGWRISNTTVEWVSAGAIGIKGDDNLMFNDKALHDGQTGFGGTGNNDLFVQDETAFNNWKGFTPFREAGGGKFAQSDGFYFDQYYAHDNVGPGLWFDAGNANFVVVNSFIYDNKGLFQNYEGTGLELEISDGPGRVEYNTFYGNTGASLDICETQGITAAHNTFSGGYLEVRDMTSRAPHHLGNIHIFDNFFLNSFISTSLGIWNTSSGTTKGIFIDGDTFDKSGTLYYWGGGQYSTLSSIFSTLGFEKNGKIGSVSFTPAPSVI